MILIRFACSLCMVGLAALGLAVPVLHADEPALLAAPATADANTRDPAPVPPATSDEAATETEAASADDGAVANTDEPATDQTDSVSSAESDTQTTSETDEEIVDNGPEPIRELYPNGTPKVDRQVILDADGNYINHGPWKSYDQRGNVTCEGTYVAGERHGLWTRWYRAGQAELLKQAPYRDFAGPFISQAAFENGKLQGKWMIFDAKQHKMSEIDFVGGIRHGKATWWHANGKIMRDVDYRDGQIDGTYVEWSADGKLVAKDTYQMGRKLGLKTQYHGKSQKKYEGMYLFAALVVDKPDSWWDAQLATYKPQGKDERHGMQTTWHPSGTMQMQGEYRDDIQVGRFTWWYANSQKAQEGSFENGKQAGLWVWWHENGQKSIQGAYAGGEPAGRWNWWQPDGKLAQTLDMSLGSSMVVKPAQPAKPGPVAAKPGAPPGRARSAAPLSRQPVRR